MSLSNISFDDVNQQVLEDQITAGVPEGILVDYKRDMYGGKDDDVKVP